MPRVYTDSDGAKVTVDDEHLEVALYIKDQLQSASPSRKCNWSEHKKMMEAEGYSDSDKNENYRQMIKHYAKSVGKLESKESYANLVAESKVQAIQEAVGEFYFSKRETQMENLKLGRLKRDLVKTAVVAQEVRDAFIDHMTFEIPSFKYSERVPSRKNKGILVITDWHIGAVVDDVNGNYYNWEIANKRLDLLKQKALDYCTMFNISDLDVVCLGDMVEHVSMRKNQQAFEAEFTMAEQIVKATDLIINLLVSLSNSGVNVEYTGIAGNHDRSNGDSKANIDGDNVMVNVNHAVNTYIRLANIDRLTYEESDKLLYSATKKYNGKTIKFVHGDKDAKQDKNKLDKHISMDETMIDALVMGHYHHYTVIEKNYSRQEIYFGSPMGRNNYSKMIKATSDASQGMIVVTEDGNIIPFRIGLQIV